MNTRQIIVIFCLFAVFFSALSLASASENVDNITVSVANDENTIEVANNDNEILEDPQGNFTQLNGDVQSASEGSILSLDKNYFSSGGDMIDFPRV